LHLAAALRKPGVALFGPTDPERNGPYGGTVEVIRMAGAETSYKRGDVIHPSMQQLEPEDVAERLLRCMKKCPAPVDARS
jgi:heptosyltransferase-1